MKTFHLLTTIALLSTISLTACKPVENLASEEYIHTFYSGDEYKIVVLADIQMAYVDLEGEVIHYAYPFDNGPDYFKEGLARYIDNEKVGFINEDLDVVIPAQFDWASYFENGESKVCNGCESVSDGDHSQMEGGSWGVLDKDGVVVWENKK